MKTLYIHLYTFTSNASTLNFLFWFLGHIQNANEIFFFLPRMDRNTWLMSISPEQIHLRVAFAPRADWAASWSMFFRTGPGQFSLNFMPSPAKPFATGGICVFTAVVFFPLSPHLKYRVMSWRLSG